MDTSGKLRYTLLGSKLVTLTVRSMYTMKRLIKTLIITAGVFCSYAAKRDDAHFFKTSMNHYFTKKSFSSPQTIKSSEWKVVESLYKKNNPSQVKPDKTIKIPQKIHFIWLGSELPTQYQYNVTTWAKHHPNWEIILWKDADIERFGLRNQKLFDAAENYGEKSDIARYEIIHREGGLYVDTDCFCLKSFEPLHYCYDFYVGVTNPGTVEINNAVIGCAPHHPLMELCISQMVPRQGPATTVDTLQRTGPAYFTRIFVENALNCPGCTIAFPPSFFYPIPNLLTNLSTINDARPWLRPETYSIHFSARSWQNTPINKKS
jgi:mannosyltransferase OCH1-like enzyme